MLFLALGVVPLAAGGCSDRNQAPTEKPNTAAHASSKADDEVKPIAKKPVEGGTIVIAANILDACNIEQSETYFAFDSADIRDGAKHMLEQVATCFEYGPMHGEGLEITGYADPRGSDEYNDTLGRDRAKSVAGFLEREGVRNDRIDVSSKGESQASDDPAQWQFDRKVVLELRS